MSRGRFTVFETTPKVLLPVPVPGSNAQLPRSETTQVPFGGPNCGRLKRLKNSVRNSIFILSSGPKYVLLNIAKSKFLTPSCRKVASTRDSSPKPHAGAEVKQLVLN